MSVLNSIRINHVRIKFWDHMVAVIYERVNRQLSATRWVVCQMAGVLWVRGRSWYARHISEFDRLLHLNKSRNSSYRSRVLWSIVNMIILYILTRWVNHTSSESYIEWIILKFTKVTHRTHHFSPISSDLNNIWITQSNLGRYTI